MCKVHLCSVKINEIQKYYSDMPEFVDLVYKCLQVRNIYVYMCLCGYFIICTKCLPNGHILYLTYKQQALLYKSTRQ